MDSNSVKQIYLFFYLLIYFANTDTYNNQYKKKNTSYKFKQKICLPVACRKPKYVLSLGTFKHRHIMSMINF